MIKITSKDGSSKEYPKGITVDEVARILVRALLELLYCG